jgi:acyl carrier protein
MPASEAVYDKVAEVLVQALNVDDDEIKPSATLQGDLGAESIDFLDIVFRLEREFGIKIPREELFPESVFQGDPQFVCDGTVTDKGMGELRSRMPYADLNGFDKDRRLTAVSDLFAVDQVARYIGWKFGQGNGSGSNGQEAKLVGLSPLHQMQLRSTRCSNTAPLRAFSQTRSRSASAYPIQPVCADSTDIIAPAISRKAGEMEWPEKCVFSRNASRGVPGERVRSLSRL